MGIISSTTSSSISNTNSSSSSSSSIISPPALNFEQRKFIELLTCPDSHEPLVTAVSLYPCMHKINKIRAEDRYGIMDVINKTCSKLNQLCVVCIEKVQSYYPDHAIRGLAERILKGTDINKVMAELQQSTALIQIKEEEGKESACPSQPVILEPSENSSPLHGTSSYSYGPYHTRTRSGNPHKMLIPLPPSMGDYEY